MSAMKIAACQMVSGPDLGANLVAASRLLESAVAQGAQLAALPEYFCLMGHQDSDKLAYAEALGHGPIKAETPDRVRNTTLVFSPSGDCVARYDKIHLFAYDNGRESYDEARVLEPGSQPTAFDAEGLRVGLSVCYDLRFPELYRAYNPCELLAVPAAFTYTTGEKHWELLLRARAVENQCYVIAPAQGGKHENGRRTWGHSMIVDPWGEVLAVVPEGEGVACADIDPARLAQVRQQLPALAHRKL
jgi:nitrilase